MQESPPTRFVFNHEGGKPSNKKRTRRKKRTSLLFPTGVTVLIVALSILAMPFFVWLLKSAELPLWIALFPLIIVVLFLIVVAALNLRHPATVQRRRKNKRRSKRKNAPYERAMRRRVAPVVGANMDSFLVMLDSLLDASWVVFRDIQLPNSAEKLDAVLVGNGGVYVMEINTDAGNYRLTDGLWEWQDWHDRWRIDQKNPIVRMYRRRDELEYILNSEYAECHVHARLIWAGEGHIDIPKSERAIWFIDDGGDSIWHDLHRGRVMPARQIEEVCWILEQFSAAPDPLR